MDPHVDPSPGLSRSVNVWCGSQTLCKNTYLFIFKILLCIWEEENIKEYGTLELHGQIWFQRKIHIFERKNIYKICIVHTQIEKKEHCESIFCYF